MPTRVLARLAYDKSEVKVDFGTSGGQIERWSAQPFDPFSDCFSWLLRWLSSTALPHADVLLWQSGASSL